MNRPNPTVTDLGMVVKLLPTPTTADGTGGHKTRGGDRSDELLLPGVADLIVSGSTGQPSNDGKPSWEDLPLFPLETTD
jgi:hypothetical protein